jgi:hypothetical protein
LLPSLAALAVVPPGALPPALVRHAIALLAPAGFRGIPVLLAILAGCEDDFMRGPDLALTPGVPVSGLAITVISSSYQAYRAARR